MSKRAAEVQLTQDNVDVLDEVTDEPGRFEVASDEQLKKRVIMKAKRIKPLGDSSTGPSIFAGLKGFQSSSLEGKSLTTTLTAPPPAMEAKKKTSPFLGHLKALNESVTKWINEHVSKNPYVDLSPIFADYKTHLSDIESKYKNTVSETESSSQEETQESECKETEVEETETTSAAESQEDEVVVKKELPSSQSILTDEEDDSLMKVKAKLFYKKGEEFCELGVGVLRVETAGDQSVRLLIRNNTTVGKVILNVRVTKDIPISSKGNNVFVVCVPNPPLTKTPDNSPTTYLIRVKTDQLAEKLLSTTKDNLN